MSKQESPITHKEFADFMEGFAEQLNKAFGYVYKRFDDIEQRLNRVENRLDAMNRDMHYVKNDTRIIPIMFDLVRTDGAEMGALKLRVDKLEKMS